MVNTGGARTTTLNVRDGLDPHGFNAVTVTMPVDPGVTLIVLVVEEPVHPTGKFH